MPTYDYICDSCQYEFEAFESIKADPQTICPACGAEQLRRKIGPGAAILFKGSGFYLTDYRSESYKKGAEADKSASSGESSKNGSSDSTSSSSTSTSVSSSKNGSAKTGTSSTSSSSTPASSNS